MGCNTSKDSVPQAEGENKENQETAAGETQEDKNTENPNEGEDNHTNGECRSKFGMIRQKCEFEQGNEENSSLSVP